MEVQVKQLRETLEILSPAVPRKPAIEALSYVRLGEGRVTATDLEVAVAVDLDGADEDLLLPLKDTIGFLRYAPGMGTARITGSKDRVTITTGGMEATFDEVPPAEDFPPLPQVSPDNDGVINGDALVKALIAVAPYAAREETRPVLNGVYLNTEDGLEVVATDGFRLAWEPVAGRLAIPSTIIPLKAVAILKHLWERAAEAELSGVEDIAELAFAKRLIRVGCDWNYLKFSFATVGLTMKTIDGTFPNYRQLIPSETATTVAVFAPDMERVIAQVMPVAKKGKGIVRLCWEEGSLLATARDDGTEVAVPVQAQFEESGKVALNVNYLIEYFKGKSGFVTMATESGPSSPVLFTYQGKDNALIMPMFVEW